MLCAVFLLTGVFGYCGAAKVDKMLIETRKAKRIPKSHRLSLKKRRK